MPGWAGVPGAAGDKFRQNRATIHLHGNNTVWISDGNTHQWITPAAENTPYPKGVSARNVPDMDIAAMSMRLGRPATAGAMTFFYTNAQSARLQFYHDHAMGITRLNVYAGEAAGYVITDAVEQDMINGTNVSGVNPGACLEGPSGPRHPAGHPGQDLGRRRHHLRPGSDLELGDGPRAVREITAAVTGDLWYPHVYMTAQNPWDLTGTNAFGRWHYGPWFNPPVPECVNGDPVGCIELGPVPNEYHQPICERNPPILPAPRPGSRHEARGSEPLHAGRGLHGHTHRQRHRLPVPGGGAQGVPVPRPECRQRPFLQPAALRGGDKTTWTPAPIPPPRHPDRPLRPTLRTAPTAPRSRWSRSAWLRRTSMRTTPSGIPNPMTKGPDWILIGTEGGFMPKPVVVPQQPIGWNLNPTTFNFGIVNQHSLLLGSAERADVVVDFSAYAGKTLILYNDAPAAFPAGVPAYDYFTGVGNQMDGGGAPTTQPGYGPNTRTIMQIRVTNAVTTPTPDVTLANLKAVFAKTATKRGVFEVPRNRSSSRRPTTTPPTTPLPLDCCGPVHPDRRTPKTFQPIDEDRGPSACRHAAARDEGDARRDGRRVRHPVRPDERHARACQPDSPGPCT